MNQDKKFLIVYTSHGSIYRFNSVEGFDANGSLLHFFYRDKRSGEKCEAYMSLKSLAGYAFTAQDSVEHDGSEGGDK